MPPSSHLAGYRTAVQSVSRAVAHLDVLYAATARAEFLIRAPPALYAYPPPVLAPMVPPRWLAHGGLGVAARRSSNVASVVGE